MTCKDDEGWPKDVNFFTFGSLGIPLFGCDGRGTFASQQLTTHLFFFTGIFIIFGTVSGQSSNYREFLVGVDALVTEGRMVPLQDTSVVFATDN